MAKSSSDAANWLWLKSWTVTVDRKLNWIMSVMRAGGNVSPELEAAFTELQSAVQTVDAKVPDKTKEGNK